jgi:hypothetical protein
MPPTATLCVAVFDAGSMFKHWAVFLDGEGNDKFMFHALGGEGRFRFEERKSNARQSKSISEVIELCKVKGPHIGTVKRIARQMPIHNEIPVWNCQDYVLEVLEELENAGVVSDEDTDYTEQKEKLAAKQEGFV